MAWGLLSPSLMKLLILAFPAALLLVSLGVGCSSSSEASGGGGVGGGGGGGGGGGDPSCVYPVVNVACSAGDLPCVPPRIPLPASQCGACEAAPQWTAGGDCLEAQGWGCMPVGDTSIWAFSGAILCESPDGGTADSGTSQ